MTEWMSVWVIKNLKLKKITQKSLNFEKNIAF